MKLRMALVAMVFAAIGAGVAVGGMAWEPWSDDAASVSSETPTPTRRPGLTQDDIEKAQRERDGLCLEALQADANAETAAYAKPSRSERSFRFYLTPPEIQMQIDRYCR